MTNKVLALDMTEKEKEADIIEIGDSVFKTCLVDKVFKFYGLDKLNLHTKNSCAAYGYTENGDAFLICPMKKVK